MLCIDFKSVQHIGFYIKKNEDGWVVFIVE